MSTAAIKNEAPVKVKRLGPNDRVIVLTDIDGMDWTFHLVPNAKVWIDGRESTLHDLRKGEEVTVVFAFQDNGEPLAREIRCERQA